MGFVWASTAPDGRQGLQLSPARTGSYLTRLVEESPWLAQCDVRLFRSAAHMVPEYSCCGTAFVRLLGLHCRLVPHSKGGFLNPIQTRQAFVHTSPFQ